MVCETVALTLGQYTGLTGVRVLTGINYHWSYKYLEVIPAKRFDEAPTCRLSVVKALQIAFPISVNIENINPLACLVLVLKRPLNDAYSPGSS